MGLQMQAFHPLYHHKWEKRASARERCTTCRQPAVMREHTLNSLLQDSFALINRLLRCGLLDKASRAAGSACYESSALRCV